MHKLFNFQLKKLFYGLPLISIVLLTLNACSNENGEESPSPADDNSEEVTREPVVFDVTNPEASGIDIISLDNDGTLTIAAPSNKVPQVGDVLCSGRTDFAPYGFILKVTDVEMMQDGATRSLDDLKQKYYLIKTVAGAVNEVLKNISIAYPVDVKNMKIDGATDSEGRSIDVTETMDNGWKMPLKALNLGNVSVTPEIIIRPQDLVIYMSIKDGDFQKFGADFKFEVETSIQVDVSLDSKFEKTIDLYHILFAPIEIPGTPIVFTPLFQVYLKFEANGKIKLSCVPIRSKYDIRFNSSYDFNEETIVPNEPGTKGYDFVDRNKDAALINLSENAISLNGSVSASIGASLSVGLMGCNLAGRINYGFDKLDFLADMLAVDLWADLTRKMSANLELTTINMKPQDGNFRFYDDCTIENFVQPNLQFHLRVWNPRKKKYNGYEPKLDPPKINFWDFEIYPTLFVPGYGDMKAEAKSDNLILSAIKYDPFFGNALFKEQSFGFRYAEYVDEETPMGKWTPVQVDNIIGTEADPIQYIYATLPFNSLEKKKTYLICPYSYGMLPAGDYSYMHRKGIFIKLDENGKLTNYELSDIPGFDL